MSISTVSSSQRRMLLDLSKRTTALVLRTPRNNKLSLRSFSENTKAPPPSTAAAAAKEDFHVDPQEEAQSRIHQNVGRLSGLEAVQAMPFSVHRNNLLTATALLGFVASVFWYSMASVKGNTTTGESTFEQEAQEALEKKQSMSQQRSKELAHLDMGVSDNDKEEGVTLAVAAPNEIATLEEEQNEQVLAKKRGGGEKEQRQQRSWWNRIVFFWK